MTGVGVAVSDHVRGEILRGIWQVGPVEAQQLADLAPFPLSPEEAGAHLDALAAQGLVWQPAPGTGFGPALDAEAAARREYARLTGAQACRVCGCTDPWACEGGCWWVEPGLCSGCAEAGA